ncbi:tumor necrosis factor receptor superfamily member 1A-like isoform X2 [Chelmon rostratus]|uniref:tumor necrosis factor receptor superfamily member 1A-like isoform X2 n=1 Tax=Chelmon rostratus TaxID=109905 RepID=UPI001BEB0144|nr:tumor necrosis factor receptor superfamily member 1A-like isoform X2 [Chelmon rostratus]
MDFGLVFPLILAFLSAGRRFTRATSNSCYSLCPRGYHKAGDCESPAAKHRCVKCENTTFTDIENTLPKCRRCDSCGHYEMEIRPCSFDADVECDCKEGYYNAGLNPNIRDCQPCPGRKGPDNSDYNRNGQSYQRCLKDPECQRKCITATSPPPTNPPATAVKSTSVFLTTAPTTPGTTASTSAPNPVGSSIPPNSVNPMLWLFFVVVVVTFLLLFWIVLLLTGSPPRYPDGCPCWRVNKDLEPCVEDPKFNEHCSHQGGSPTTLTLNISEDSPMMTVSQSPTTSEHLAHISPEHKVARQDDKSEHWPAIVLYAIIKEVPLRRWKEFLRLLSVADQQLERVELEAGLGLGSMERQYQMLRLWSQHSSASLNDVFSALHYMDLSGCAQLLQESLEKLEWTPELKQGFRDHGFNGAMQDT